VVPHEGHAGAAQGALARGLLLGIFAVAGGWIAVGSAATGHLTLLLVVAWNRYISTSRHGSVLPGLSAILYCDQKKMDVFVLNYLQYHGPHDTAEGLERLKTMGLECGLGRLDWLLDGVPLPGNLVARLVIFWGHLAGVAQTDRLLAERIDDGLNLYGFRLY